MAVRVALAVLAAVGAASAGGGQLDPRFSGDGWVRTLELKAGSEFYLAGPVDELALQRDGKVVAAGALYGSHGLARYRLR